MELPPPADIALVLTGALAAGFANGLSGMGYGLLSMGLWLHAMPPTTAVPLVAICSVSGHVQSLPRIWKGVVWSRLWPFLVTALFGVPIGVTLLRQIPAHPLKLGLGVFLVAYTLWMGLVRRPPIVRGGGRLADAAIGFAGGILGGLSSMSGPVPAIWSQLRGWNMHEQRGVNQPYNMTTLAMTILTALVAGIVDHKLLIWAALTLPVTIVSARFGLACYGRINDVQFKRIILVMLAISGASLVFTALTS